MHYFFNAFQFSIENLSCTRVNGKSSFSFVDTKTLPGSTVCQFTFLPKSSATCCRLKLCPWFSSCRSFTSWRAWGRTLARFSSMNSTSCSQQWLPALWHSSWVRRYPCSASPISSSLLCMSSWWWVWSSLWNETLCVNDWCILWSRCFTFWRTIVLIKMNSSSSGVRWFFDQHQDPRKLAQLVPLSVSVSLQHQRAEHQRVKEHHFLSKAEHHQQRDKVLVSKLNWHLSKWWSTSPFSPMLPRYCLTHSALLKIYVCYNFLFYCLRKTISDLSWYWSNELSMTWSKRLSTEYVRIKIQFFQPPFVYNLFPCTRRLW